jgi:glycosyltransferase involved in cell wall biosynthesis
MDRARYDVVFYVPTITPLLVGEGVPPGGAETQIILISRALARHGLRVAIVAYEPPGSSLPESVDGVDVIGRNPYRPHQRLIGKIREAFFIYKTLSRIDTRVVVTRMAGAHVGLVAASAKLRRRAFVYSSANISDFNFEVTGPKRRDLLLFKLGVRLADRVIVQTDEQAELCRSTFRRDSVTIRSIAEVPAALDARAEAIVWIGRLVWYKRPEAFLALARALPDVMFRMVAVPSSGEPALAEAVRAEAALLANLELIEPLPRDRLMDVIESAVAIANTADFEGMPNIFLEGWARGVPALSLTHDPDGVIAEHGVGRFAAGSVRALEVAARELWEQRGDARETAARCRRYVEENHADAVVARRWAAALRFEPTPAGSPLEALS